MTRGIYDNIAKEAATRDIYNQRVSHDKRDCYDDRGIYGRLPDLTFDPHPTQPI